VGIVPKQPERLRAAIVKLGSKAGKRQMGGSEFGAF
jgi:hypothetical protein